MSRAFTPRMDDDFGTLGGDWDDDLDTLGRNESFEDSNAEVEDTLPRCDDCGERLVEDEWSGDLSCPSCGS